MRFRITADDRPLPVTFEPAGMEYALAPGDHLTVEWTQPAHGPEGTLGEVEHSSYGIRLLNFGSGMARAWASGGEELLVLG